MLEGFGYLRQGCDCVELNVAHDIGDAILQLQRLLAEQRVIVGLFRGTFGDIFELLQLCRQPRVLFFPLLKEVVNPRDFLGRAPALGSDNRLNVGERGKDTLIETGNHFVQPLPALDAAGVVQLLVLAPRRIQGGLHGL